MGHENSQRKPVIGLLGGIGAGKSTVADELGRLGCAVIDADRIGHELLGDATVQREIRRQWGEGVFAPTGQVDREALGRIVFSDPGQLERMNALLHPRIHQQIRQEIAEAQAAPETVAIVLDAAVMLEAGWDKLCSHWVFVDAEPADRAARVRGLRGWGERLWRQREKMQISLDKKREKCQYTVDNRSSEPHLRERIRQLFRRILHDADRP